MTKLALSPNLIAAILLTSVAFSEAADEGGDATRLVPTASQLEADESHYGVYITGKKIGWMEETSGKGEFEGREAFAIKLTYLQKLLNDGEPITVESIDEEYYSTDPPYRLLAARMTDRQNGFEAVTELRLSEDGGYTARILSGRSERTKQLGELDFTLADSLTAGSWCESQPAVGDEIFIRELSLTDLKITKARYSVTEILPGAGAGGDAEGVRYRLDYFDYAEKTRAELTTDRRGKMIRGKVSGTVELVLEPEEQAKDLEAALDLFAASLVKVDQRLGDPSELRAMELEITGPGLAVIRDSANQKADYDPESKRLLLKIGREHGIKQPVTDRERERALEETSAYPIEDPQVRMLAELAVRKATRPRARIKRLVDFVDEFIIDDYGNEPLSVIDIIDTQRGDCTEHSQLFVTLARAAGIPAREVSGFIYGEGAENSFGGHAWCEVEVEGHWHPVDPTWGETVINATHIRISGEKPSSEEMEIYMGGLAIRVLSTTDRQGEVRSFAEPARPAPPKR